MEIKRRDEIAPFEFAEFVLREMTPAGVEDFSIAEITVPIGADRPDRLNELKHRIYSCRAGEIEFRIDGVSHRVGRGDLIHIERGETYGFHNGGYEEGRLLLIRVPDQPLGTT